MDIRVITPHYAVSPQIAARDLSEIRAAGYTTVICNRPDEEVPPELRADAIAAAAKEAGVTFHVLPLTHQTMTEERLARQRAFIEGSEGPVLAYCASGTRCSVAWALAHARDLGSDAVLDATTRAGYPLEQLRPQLDALATGRAD